jgi:glycerophosphoryl diester phosphodiesterase
VRAPLSCALVTIALMVAACADDEAAAPDTAPTSNTASSTAPSSSTSDTAVATTTSIAPTTVATEPEPLVPARSLDELLALGRPIVLAHSGGEDAYPSETMFAFEQSAAAGVDMLDINLQLSADGTLMAFHDDTLDRTTNGTGPVADLTATELWQLDAAYWFTPSCGACTDQPLDQYVYRGVRTGDVPPPPGHTADDFRPPTLQEVVVRFPLAPLNVEIKGDGDAGVITAIALSTFISDNPYVADRIVVSSFNDEALARFRSLQPDIEVSPGLNDVAAWVLARVPLPDGMRILQIPPVYEGTEVITAQLVADSTAAGYPIWVWPNDRALENETSYLDFLRLGVTGLNINQPAEGVAAVRQFTGG